MYGEYMVSYSGKTKTKYEKIGIPTEMVDEIKKVIENDKRLGFVSVQEFVKESVRKNIVQYSDNSINKF